MSDRLDKDLGGHIRAVFDAYDEPFDPASWQKLQHKRRKKTALLYLKRGGIAAAIALLLLAGARMWSLRIGPDLPLASAREDAVPAPPEGSGTGGDQPAVGSDISGSLDSPGSPSSGDAQNKMPSNTYAGIQGSSAPGAAGTFEENAALPAGPSGQLLPAGAAADNQMLPETSLAENSSDWKGKAAEPAGPASALPSGEETALAAEPLAPGTTGQDREVTGYPGSSGVGDTPATDSPGRHDLPLATNRPEEKTSRFSFGFVTTSLMNYASGNNGSQVHFGAGITSGVKLGKKLSVHSGLILAGNSLSLDKSNSSVRNMQYSSDSFTPQADLAPAGKPSLVSKNNFVQEVSPNSMDVDLLVVDIPLNLTYRVDLGGSDLLLTGGLSSFAYLDQQYSYHNTVVLYPDKSLSSPEPVVRNERPLSHFDFAKQLNLAIGTEVPLGKGSSLILEPYVKYPLGDLTSEHIRYGSAGMNLRLSLGGK